MMIGKGKEEEGAKEGQTIDETREGEWVTG